jgi:hypothetical protein
VQESGFASIGLLTPLRRLYPLPVRRASALPTASFRFHLAMDTLAVQLTLPLAGRVEDFHLQVTAPCRAHQRKREIATAISLSVSGRCLLYGLFEKSLLFLLLTCNAIARPWHRFQALGIDLIAAAHALAK